MKDFVITEAIENKSKGRVFFYALWKGKKKSWNVSKGLFEVLKELELVQMTGGKK